MASHSEEKSKTPLIVSIVTVLAVVVSYFTISNVQDFMDNAWDVLSSGDQKRIENWVVQFGALGFSYDLGYSGVLYCTRGPG